MREFQSVFCISDVRECCALNICCDRDKVLWAEELNIHEDPSDPIKDQQTLHQQNKPSSKEVIWVFYQSQETLDV